MRRALGLALLCMLPAFAFCQSLANGQRIVEKNCMQCHGIDKSSDGPALRGIVGRAAGKLDGYFYSEALANATHTWDLKSLKAWLTKPESMIPGVEMDFHLETQQDIDDVIAYLATLKSAEKK